MLTALNLIIPILLACSATLPATAEPDSAVEAQELEQGAPSAAEQRFVLPDGQTTQVMAGIDLHSLENGRLILVDPSVGQPRSPFFAPEGSALSRRSQKEAHGVPPAAASPEMLPYFGQRQPGMPSTHFMDVRIPIEIVVSPR